MPTPALKGNDFLLRIAVTPTSTTEFVTVAAMRTTSMTLNKSVVDITNKSSLGWSESLGGGGVKNMALTASGIFTDDLSLRTLMDAYLSNGRATGYLSFAVNPTTGDTVTLNGVTVTFDTDVDVEATLAETLAGLATFLNASVNASLTVASYEATETLLIVRFDTLGASGNAYTLAASDATRSAPTLTGGGQHAHWNAELDYGNGERWVGSFNIDSISYAGDQNDVQTFEVSMSSSGFQTYEV